QRKNMDRQTHNPCLCPYPHKVTVGWHLSQISTRAEPLSPISDGSDSPSERTRTHVLCKLSLVLQPYLKRRIIRVQCASHSLNLIITLANISILQKAEHRSCYHNS